MFNLEEHLERRGCCETFGQTSAVLLCIVGIFFLIDKTTLSPRAKKYSGIAIRLLFTKE